MTAYVSKFDDDLSYAVIMDAAWRGLEHDKILPTTDDRARLNRLIIRLAYLRQCSLQFSGAQIAAMFLGIGKEGTHYTNWNFSKSVSMDSSIITIQPTTKIPESSSLMLIQYHPTVTLIQMKRMMAKTLLYGTPCSNME